MQKSEILKNKTHIHFIGIGGSGMYPLAQILHQKGYNLSGSDNNETETLDAVRKMGIPVFMGQRAENIEGADLIVYSAAIMADNPELMAARASGVPTIERKELLGLVTSWYPSAICISGTHGKTTTTAMTVQIMHEAGEDFGCLIGGKLPVIGGSGRAGAGEIGVFESCEFSDTFLMLYPDIAVILNIDEDHLDYFKTMERLKASFREFAENATKCVIFNGDDENTVETLAGLSGKDLITFGWSDKNDYYPVILQHSGLLTRFEIYYRGERLFETELHVPGRHNVLNAVAAVAAAIYAGVGVEHLQKGICEFKGAMRRFEKIAQIDGVTIADDYAHHPTEVAALLKTAKELGFKRLIAVHQPFTYSRTYRLLNEFAEALTVADEVVLTEIMGGREKNTYGIYAKDLAAKIPDCVLTPTFDECVEYLKGHVREGDLVITFGCGDVYKVAKRLAKAMENC